MDQLKQVIVTPDGVQHETRAEALEHLRKPQVKTALLAVTGGNAQLADWLLENRDTVESAFESGTIRRVTKSEKAKLMKALEALKAVDNKALSFLQDNAAAIADSFRWPSVTRMTEEEKNTAARNTLVGASDNPELADWVLNNRDSVMAAFQAGVVKRVVSPRAQEALAEYRARKAAAAAAAAAGASETTEEASA